MNIQIKDIENQGNLILKINFMDHTSQLVDVGGFIRSNPHPQYNKYLAPDKFKTYKIEHGNIVWGNNWDLIFPVEDLYEGKLNI